jgi:peptidoglycan/LPS O-acetylase OafA/YrhL
MALGGRTTSPHETPVGALHLDHLDGVRALAALVVVYDHAWLSVWLPAGRRAPRGGIGDLTEWLVWGHFAVGLFIVISGFCLMLPVVRAGTVLRGGARSFLRRRARRIVPPFYLAVVFSLLLIGLLIGRDTGTHWDVAIPVTWRGLLANLFLVQDVVDRGQINVALWSVAVEWHIYFLFPILIWAWRRFGVVSTAAAAFVVSVVGFIALRHTALANAEPQYLLLFVLGMIGAAVCFSPDRPWSALRERVPWSLLAAASLAVLVALIAVLGRAQAQAKEDYLDFLVGGFALCLLVAATRPRPTRLTRFFGWRPLTFLGTFAYSIYLVHAPLLQVVWQYGLHPLGLDSTTTLALLVSVGIPLVVAVAYGFFLLCELPFMNTKPAPTIRLTLRRRRVVEAEAVEAHAAP